MTDKIRLIIDTAEDLRGHTWSAVWAADGELHFERYDGERAARVRVSLPFNIPPADQLDFRDLVGAPLTRASYCGPSKTSSRPWPRFSYRFATAKGEVDIDVG